jgi:hypothetical protein
MPARPSISRRWRVAGRLALETLEARALPSHTSWPGLSAPEVGVAGATLDAAYRFLTPLVPGGRAEAIDTITNSAAGGGNVDWYEFTLPSAADVTVTTPPGQGAGLVVPVLSLYNTAPIDHSDPTQNDPYTPDGHRLLAQDDGAAHGGVATIEQVLAPGTYYVAVSGTGDHDFYPFLAGSGETGGTGDYGLEITAAPLANPPVGPGPAIIAATPADGAALASSPFAIYLELNAPIDPSTIQPGVNVVLNDLTAGVPVQLQQNANVWTDATNGVLYNPTDYELQIFPEAPLAPGDTYQLQIAGSNESSLGASPVLGPDGSNLGSTSPGGDGQDYFLTFQVSGVKGVPGTTTAFNTIDTAHDLGLTTSGLVQVYGAIGNDPSALAQTGSAANDVDLYHFTVPDTRAHYAFLAAAEASRVGSPLQTALALFQDVGGVVTLIASDMGTGNQTQGTDGSHPLANDSLLETPLGPGDYYLAVGGVYNLPDAAIGLPYVQGGGTGTFDPTVPYSAQDGFVNTTGAYLLTASLKADNVAPHVTAVDGLSTPGVAPTFITVHFDKDVNLRELGYLQALSGPSATMNAVWVHASDGQDYHPRLVSYDGATHVATFCMLDDVPNGPAALYLAAVAPDGSPGLTDLAGNRLVGSDAAGDYVVPFTVDGVPHVKLQTTTTNNVTFTAQGFHETVDNPQFIGPLFPNEMAGGHAVDVLGTITAPVNGPTALPEANTFEIQVLQDRTYGFTLTTQVPPPKGKPATPTHTVVRIYTLDGQEIGVPPTGNVSVFSFHLKPGRYIVQVGPLTSSVPLTLAYRLRITLGTSFENAVTLTVGAAPPYAIAASSASSAPSSPSSPPVLSLPGSSGVVGALGTTTGAAALALTLPSSAISGLSAPPVGGVSTVNPSQAAGPDHLVLAGLTALEGSVQTAVLTGNTAAAADADRASALAGRVMQILGVVERLAVDLLFHSGDVADWLRSLALPYVVPDGPASGAVPPNGSADPGADENPEVEEPAPSAGGADWAWAAGLLGAGAAVILPPPHHRRRRAARLCSSRNSAERGPA